MRKGSASIVLALVVLVVSIYLAGIFVLAQPVKGAQDAQTTGAAINPPSPITGGIAAMAQPQNLTLVLVFSIFLLNIYMAWRSIRKEHFDATNFRAVRDDLTQVREAVLRKRRGAGRHRRR